MSLPVPAGRLYYLTDRDYTVRTRTDAVVIHCSATPATHDVTMAEMRGWHVKERKWRDVGYHFAIRRDGTLELGRPVWATGAGVEGWNADSVHVCLAGGTDAAGREENNFTPAQWRTLRSLVLTLRALDPGAEVVKGHREYPNVTKFCPSFDVGAWLAREGIPRRA